jgi:hypothetical protein
MMNVTSFGSTRRTLAFVALLAGMGVLPSAADTPAANAPVPVKVERIKPKKEKHPTLRFLKSNRAFLRSELDRLREKPIASEDAARAVDPRHLLYRDMLAAIGASVDSVRSEKSRSEQREILASIAELASLEDQLDAMERQLAGQHERLSALEHDFLGRQVTALLILAKGVPGGIAPTKLAVTDEDGNRIEIPLTEPHVAALRGGGLAEVYHEFVEPREQVFELAVGAPAWSTDAVRYLVLEPPRGQLTFLEIDLAALAPETGELRATAWTQVAETAPLLGEAPAREGSD